MGFNFEKNLIHQTQAVNNSIAVFENVKIIDTGSEGKAVARIDEKVIFVPWVVPGDVVGDIVDNVIRNHHLPFLGAIVQNSHSGFFVQRLQVDGKTGTEAADQAKLHSLKVFGWSVRGEDNLTARLIEGVEGVEKFQLCFRFTCQKLNVVQYQDIYIPVKPVEFC